MGERKAGAVGKHFGNLAVFCIKGATGGGIKIKGAECTTVFIAQRKRHIGHTARRKHGIHRRHAQRPCLIAENRHSQNRRIGTDKLLGFTGSHFGFASDRYRAMNTA